MAAGVVVITLHDLEHLARWALVSLTAMALPTHAGRLLDAARSIRNGNGHR
ncbi:MAG TPA: hypothetical protein VD931_10410 [Baekduia sp.]|nr:hypothetical protein [Baekduia sp.]